MPRIVDSFIAELEQEAATTRKVLERVPADKWDWKPHEKSFSLGGLAYHIATIPGVISKMVAPDSFDIADFQKSEPRPKEELLTALDESVAEAKKYLESVDDERAMATWRFTAGGQTKMEAPRIGVIRMIMLSHWYHHRGQMLVYLRLLDIPVPSVYGPTADDNPFA